MVPAELIKCGTQKLDTIRKKRVLPPFIKREGNISARTTNPYPLQVH